MVLNVRMTDRAVVEDRVGNNVQVKCCLYISRRQPRSGTISGQIDLVSRRTGGRYAM